jgi:hypothetical protein
MRAMIAAMSFAVAAGGAVNVGQTVTADRPSGCNFAISPLVTPPQIVGENDAARRAWVMAQPDSPLRILRVDLSGIDVTAGPGWFTRSGRHVMDVQNVTDEVITRAEVMVKVAFAEGSGVGSGTKLDRPLKPGEWARLEWKSGSGRGNHGSAGEVSVVALVQEVETAACTYRPSQAWPTSHSGSQR